MPREYKKELGSRNYVNYKPEILEECLDKIRSGELSQRKAAAAYSIPRSTIKNKLKGLHQKHRGRPTVFSDAEEQSFVQHLIQLSECGYPVTEMDFRMTVKEYLSRKGVAITQFKTNVPGYEWCKSFLKRHRELTARMSKNIKKVRATLSEDVLNEYLTHLEATVKDVPPDNIWNFDETNLTDDPGVNKVLCKRGMKYVETVCNHSKSAISLMFCGSAVGEMFPPYVVYKAEHLWSTWVENGPRGVRYNRTKSGWFDSIVFEDWFNSLVLPRLRRLPGTKVLIGDNLSSHISPSVISLCQEHGIKFICLPPNSTHLTQPLDVAFFSPMKRAWRKILRSWKDSCDSDSYSVLPKDVFPAMLSRLLSALEENQAENLKAGFKKCSIYPIDKTQLLSRLPRFHTVDISVVGDAFLKTLEDKRRSVLGDTSIRKRRRKIDVTAGKSITPEDIVQPCHSRDVTDSIKRKRGRPPKIVSDSTDSSENEDDIMLESDAEPETFSDLEGDVQQQTSLKGKLTVGDYVTVLYDNEEYPGIVTELSEEGTNVNCMEKTKSFYKWPEQRDELFYPWEDLIRIINPPRPTKRGYFQVPELQLFI